MIQALTIAVAVFFIAMGVVTLVHPGIIGATFGHTLTVDGRNEVRAVYGGFGVLVGVVIALAPTLPAFRPGIYFAVSIALAGMALGRFASALVERPRAFYPCWFYCGGEILMALVLLEAALTA